MIALHKNAPTTLAIRAEMVTTLETAVALALCDSVSQSINEKRKSLARFNVASHIPQRLQTTFTPTQKQIVVVLRKILLLRFDDLLAVSRKFLSLQDTSSGLDRFPSRHNVGNPNAPKPEGPTETNKPFKSYESPLIPIDVKYRPQMPNATSRRDMLVPTDRAARLVFVQSKCHNGRCRSLFSNQLALGLADQHAENPEREWQKFQRKVVRHLWAQVRDQP